MLETIREFGLEQLAQAGEETETRQRHAAYVVAFCEQGYPNHFGPFTDLDQRLQQLEDEQPNLRAALAFLAGVDDADGVLRLAGALALFWLRRGHMREGRQWLEWALAHTAEAQTDARCRALVGLGSILLAQGEYEQATLLARAALAIAEAIDNQEIAAHAIHVLGLLAEAQQTWEEAEALFVDALARWRALDAWAEEAVALLHLSSIAFSRGDRDLAARHAEASLTRFRALGYASGAGMALCRLGRLARDRGDGHEAALAYHEALELWSSRNDHWYIMQALAGLAELASAYGQSARGGEPPGRHRHPGPGGRRRALLLHPRQLRPRDHRRTGRPWRRAIRRASRGGSTAVARGGDRHRGRDSRSGHLDRQRAHRAGARRAAAHRGGAHRSGDRRRALPQPPHRQRPRRAHPDQARGPHPPGGHVRARDWVCSPERRARAAYLAQPHPEITHCLPMRQANGRAHARQVPLGNVPSRAERDAVEGPMGCAAVTRRSVETREGACIMRRIALIATVVFVLTGLIGIGRGIDGLAAQEAPADYTGHAWVGTWMATTPGGLALGDFAADGSVVMGLQATQAGPMGVAYVSGEVGRWEPVDERTAHFTAVQMLSDADGQFIGTITIDGYPVVNDDGQSFIDDGSRGA